MTALEGDQSWESLRASYPALGSLSVPSHSPPSLVCNCLLPGLSQGRCGSARIGVYLSQDTGAMAKGLN